MLITSTEGTQIIEGFIEFGSDGDAVAFGRRALPAIEAALAESGCVDYAMGLDFIDPRKVRTYQNWASAESRIAHTGQAQARSLAAATAELGASRVEITRYSPLVGMSGLTLHSEESESRAASGPPPSAGPNLEKMLQLVQVFMRFDSDADVERHIAYAQEPVLRTREEPGAVEYSWWRDFRNPLTVRLTELWRDQATMFAHVQADHAKAHVEYLKGFDTGPVGDGEERQGAVFFFLEPHQQHGLGVDGL
ncbi:antibiotic biosynthesis monooxygenase [Streptomyces sp. NPDC051985]|uniref:putative quinol monooxygenase n=1 Tax=Streptomyces sp. NPDC051985 TaxID=3155807 RepID=UPI0034220067